ncbi:MAG: hypothetical protein K1000chlam1_01013, partial [Candidatus Anoxychlamydiales bacterium]|nr:hypothetical protein [Candidatus Anoxychlamydiales bacterium]
MTNKTTPASGNAYLYTIFDDLRNNEEKFKTLKNHLERNKIESAITIFNQMKEDPFKDKARLEIIITYLELNQIDKAVALFHEMEEGPYELPDRAIASQKIIEAYLKQNQTENAIIIFDKMGAGHFKRLARL